MLRFVRLLPLLGFLACSADEQAMRSPGPPPSVGGGGDASRGDESHCDQTQHAWVKALAGGLGEVLYAGPGDDLATILSGLSDTKPYALVLSEGIYGALALPGGVELSILGECNTSVTSEAWTGGSGSTLKLTGMHFGAGLSLTQPLSAEIDKNELKNANGDAMNQQGGSLQFTENTIIFSAGHGLAIERVAGVIIGDNHFLGPLGGDGVFSDEQEGDLRLEGNRFEQAQGNGLTMLRTKPSVAGVIIGDNHFLGPLGGDGVFSSNQTPLQIHANRFERINGNGLSMVEQRAAVIIGDNHFLGPLGGDGIFSWESGSASPSQIERNAIDNSARFGVFLAQPQGAFNLEGNRVSASGERGILIQDGIINSQLIVRDNTIEGALGSGLEVIGHLGQVTISGNVVDKVQSEEVGGAEPPASGFGIVALDSPLLQIHDNEIKRTSLASIVVDLAQSATQRLGADPYVRIGRNAFDGLAKYDVVLQNMGNTQPEADENTMESGSAPGFGERFVMRRKRAANRRCGNGAVEGGEACDDGNRIDHDSCTNTCERAVCGDGIRRRDLIPGQDGYEDCDLGGDNALCWACNLRFPRHLAAGQAHACLLRDGAAYCWGDNSQGQVTGQITRAAIPAPHAFNVPDVSVIAAGDKHSCLLADRNTHCFGRPEDYQLFNTNFACGTSHNTRWPDYNLEDLVAGGHASCFRRDSEGSGSAGWLCSGRLSNMHLFNHTERVGDDEQATNILLGGSHFCITSPLGVHCAGDNSLGAISNDPSNPSRLTPIGVEPGLRLALANHVTCYITADERVRCRGDYQHGRLGRGGSGRCSENCARDWAEVSNLSDVATVSIGDFHACALDRHGRVTCWGQNQYLALGLGTQGLRSAPTAQVPLPTKASQIVVGRHFSCAELVDGRVFCWGKNNAAQLGRGNAGEPQEVGAIAFP